MPTNGFHPLWQAIVAGVFAVTRLLHASDLSAAIITLGLGLVAIATMLVLFGETIVRARGRLSLLYVFAPVGIYGLLIYPLWLRSPHTIHVPALQGTLFSYVNGMESAIVLLAFAVLAHLHSRGTMLGPALAALTLARLDTIFIAASVLALCLAEALRSNSSSRLRQALGAAVVLVGTILVYLAFNRSYAHTFLPVSGAMKSTFPHLNYENLDRARRSLLHPFEDSPYRVIRVALLVVPAIAATIVIASALARGRFFDEPPLHRFLVATAVGVLAISLYDLAFVELAEQGPWYHPIGTFFVTLCAVDARSRRVALFRQVPIRAAGLLALAAATLFVFVRDGRAIGSHHAWSDFYFDEAPRIRAFYEAHSEHPRFLEVDDGIFGFATGYPTMSGKGLALDAAAAQALAAGRLTPLAVERGYTRISSVLYMDASGFSPRSSSPSVCQLVMGVVPPALCDRYRFSVEYAHGRYAVVSVEPLTLDDPRHPGLFEAGSSHASRSAPPPLRL